MSGETSFEFDIVHFVSSLGRFLGASPRESQIMTAHIFKQIEAGARYSHQEHLEDKKGYETVIILEANDLKISKRIFHPRDLRGIDFAISKTKNNGLASSVVQVKRNHRQPHFTFRESKHTKELTQLRTFSQWRSSYYLMVDETTNPPLDCFVSSAEIIHMIHEVTGSHISSKNLKRVRLPNELVHNYCRGTRLFYEAFYNCVRGAWRSYLDFERNAFEYITSTKRAIAEIYSGSWYPAFQKKLPLY